MKTRLFICVLALMLTVSAGYAQDGGTQGITYKFLGVDTHSPYASTDDAGARTYEFAFDAREAVDVMQAGIEIGYFYGVKDWLVVGAPFRVGRFRQFYADRDPVIAYENPLFFQMDARLNLQAQFKDQQRVVPYITTGLGATKIEDREMDMQVPLGAGINFRLASNFYLQVQTEYRWSFDEIRDKDILSFTNNMQHSAGFLFQLGDAPAKPTPPPPPPPPVEEPKDMDGDGIIDADDSCPEVAGLAKFGGCPDTDGDDIQDSEDDCPEVAGLAAFKGCPDSDNDGIADKEDDCPNEAGPAANKGCPIVVKDRDNDGVPDDADACPDTPGLEKFAGCPDTDGDGVPNKDDKCPSTPGSAAFNGCPDTDGDGVEDAKDKCPTTPGLVSNQGCPKVEQADEEKIKFATKGVEFETASATIRTRSYPVLDELVNVMNKYPNYSMSISGHTDNVGAEASNQALSEKRAKACYDYLISKGVSPSRLSYAGYGESRPIADNGSKEGRQKNRRVEFNIFLK